MSSSNPRADGLSSPDFLQRASQQYRILKAGVLVILALACAIPFSLNLVDPDLWGHIRYAQDWLANGELPRTATHTYTAADYPWINHENGAELAFALGYERLGIYGMLALKCVLGLAIVGTMAWTAARHGVKAVAMWALLVLIAANMQAFSPLRPQLFSFALCTAALVCLDRAFSNWREAENSSLRAGSSPTPAPPPIRFAWLWALPPIFALWVNFHGGFVAGLCIVGAYLLGRMIETALHGHSEVRRGVGVAPSADLGGTGLRKALPSLIHLAAIGVACVAATAINPYGLGMHAWLWNSWGGAPPEITEWAPPMPGKPVFWPFVTLLAVAAASLAATRRRRDWTQIVILVLVAWQASMHLRHIAFFALLCGFWLPVHWQSAVGRLRPDAGRLPVVLPALWLRMTMAAAIVLAIVLQSVALARRLSDFPVRRTDYPVDALQFMADHSLSGKLVVAFNWAQYAIAALAPDVTVQFDGRFDTCYPQEVIDMHFDFLLGDTTGPRERSPASGPMDGLRVLEHGQPALVLVERRYKQSVAMMQAAAKDAKPRWTLLYRDAVAELWGRSSRYDDPASPDFLPREVRRFDVSRQEAHVQWPALPAHSLSKTPSMPVFLAPPAPGDANPHLSEL